MPNPEISKFHSAIEVIKHLLRRRSVRLALAGSIVVSCSVASAESFDVRENPTAIIPTVEYYSRFGGGIEFYPPYGILRTWRTSCQIDPSFEGGSSKRSGGEAILKFPKEWSPTFPVIIDGKQMHTQVIDYTQTEACTT